MIQAWDSCLFQLRERVKIILGRFMLFVLCHYTAIFAKASDNLIVPLVFVGSTDIVIFLFLKNK